jgi:WS/DGAT/MGAT family acyltransferase
VSQSEEQLTALDATFLELEQADEGATMHIGGIMVFDPLPGGGSPSLAALRASLAARLAQLPRYSQRLSSERTGGLAWPYWRDDPRFDIRNHVRRAAVASPGGEPELCDWAGEFFSHRLDRTRPLWEMVLLDGLAGGRWAIASKTHHALVDGVGSVGLVELLLDASPDGLGDSAEGLDGPDAPWEAPPPQRPGVLAGTVGAVTRAAGSTLHAALHPRDALERSRSLVELLVSNEVSAAPRTTLNVPISAVRRYRVTHAKLADVKAIGHEIDGSVNDVLLAACTAGLRELMLSRGERPPGAGVRAMVPVNIRGSAERLALGNRVSSLFVHLPVACEGRLERLTEITHETTHLKTSHAGLGAEAMLDLASLAPPVLHALLARSLYATRLFNITITNVPGPRAPLYSLGARLHAVYPLVPLAADHAIGIAIFSYLDEIAIGISADRDSCPDLDVLVSGIEHELEALGGLTTRASPATPTGASAAAG